MNRRKFLQRAGLAAAVGTMLPLLGAGGERAFAAVPSSADPDKLFKDGPFKRAEHGYRRLLRENADNAHAAAQIGYIALLSNRFADAKLGSAADTAALATEVVTGLLADLDDDRSARRLPRRKSPWPWRVTRVGRAEMSSSPHPATGGGCTCSTGHGVVP
ncbi:hypothetical protein GCM10010411_48090 [Actinomadura fulvescens]|uniref:Twin-arginine translocation signal domain-containing protein n=1 Tax=Actinomadura fulvescens TaxID=46160 RepID=A0ABN3PZC4_9ACTN